MKDDTGRLDLEVAADRAKASVPREIVKAALDAIAPFTEGLGALGDQLRIWRERSLLRAALQAKQLAEQEGIDVRIASPKFLSLWIEGASSEPDENNITELWARLLVRGAHGKNALNIALAKVLQSITASEAEVLTKIYNQGEFSEQWTKINLFARRHQVEFMLKSIFDDPRARETLDRKTISMGGFYPLLQTLLPSGCPCFPYVVYDVTPTKEGEITYGGHPFYDARKDSFHVLEREKLIQSELVFRGKGGDGKQYEIYGFILTDLGMALMTIVGTK